MQLTMGAVRNPSAATGWTQLLAAVRAAASAISVKELAFALDLGPTYLADALREAERKPLKMEWLSTILVMAPEANVDELLGAQARLRCRRVERVKVLTIEEEFAAYKANVHRLAPAVDAMADAQVHGGMQR